MATMLTSGAMNVHPATGGQQAIFPSINVAFVVGNDGAAVGTRERRNGVLCLKGSVGLDARSKETTASGGYDEQADPPPGDPHGDLAEHNPLMVELMAREHRGLEIGRGALRRCAQRMNRRCEC